MNGRNVMAFAKRNISIAKYRVLHADVHVFLGNLLRNQVLPFDELERLNWQKRKRLLTYAFENVPIYRRKYADAGLNPSDIRSPEDFENLPIIRKEDLRNHFSDFLSKDARPSFLEPASTGGSTGVPVRVMHDKRVPTDAFRRRMYSWWGIDPSVDADEAIVWRAVNYSPLEEFRHKLIRKLTWPKRLISLDASSMTEDDIRRFLSEFNHLRTPVLRGYVGALYHVALFAKRNHITTHPAKAVWASSSPFSESQRRLMEEIFQAPVYDQYGCGEVPLVAAQCRQKEGLHILHDSVHVECVDYRNHSVSRGKPGRILLTDLENYAFPLIRYENGDRGRLLPEPCACGISLPLMDKIQGRISDMIFLPHKTSISGVYLTTVFDSFPDVAEQFQIRQKKDGSLRVLYVPANHHGDTLEKALASIEEELTKRVRHQVPVVFEAVRTIPHDRGKLRFIIRE